MESTNPNDPFPVRLFLLLFTSIALLILAGLVMLIAFVVIMVNFLVDMAYMVLNPRIKYAD